MSRIVSIVAAGPKSLATYWESASEIWAVKRTLFALKDLGFNVHRTFWLDNINHQLLMLHRSGELEEALIHGWKYGPDLKVYTPQQPTGRKLEHFVEFDFIKVAERANSDLINCSTVMALAQAYIEDDITELHLHGIDNYPFDRDDWGFAKMKDMIRQAEATGYWIGRLEAKGVRIRINPASPCLETNLTNSRGFRARGMRFETAEKMPTTNMKAYAKSKKLGAFIDRPAVFVMDEKGAPVTSCILMGLAEFMVRDRGDETATVVGQEGYHGTDIG